ncbi:MAG TPA: hypothetical protein VGH22_15360 [Candidatus Binatia bacterium]|jgi:ElaB/YqjD/DUF883 family membrane-anchored ribosome-binding protein
MSKIEESSFSERTGDTTDPFTQIEPDISRLRSAASRAVENGKAVAQRWGRQSRSMCVNATDHIKDDPLRSAAITFVIGLSLGALVGRWSGRHQCQ